MTATRSPITLLTLVAASLAPATSGAADLQEHEIAPLVLSLTATSGASSLQTSSNPNIVFFLRGKGVLPVLIE